MEFTQTVSAYDLYLNLVNIFDKHISKEEFLTVDHLINTLEILEKDNGNDSTFFCELIEKLSNLDSADLANLIEPTEPTEQAEPTESTNVQKIIAKLYEILFFKNWFSNSNESDLDSLDWSIRMKTNSELLDLKINSFEKLIETNIDDFINKFIESTKIGRKDTKYEPEFPIFPNPAVNPELEIIEYGKKVWESIEKCEQTHGPFKYMTYIMSNSTELAVMVTEKKEYERSKLKTTVITRKIKEGNTLPFMLKTYFIY
jgi:hypothetical protein